MKQNQGRRTRKQLERKGKRFIYLVEGSYKHCIYWFTFCPSGKLTKYEAKAELQKRKQMHDFTVWRIAKFEREAQ